MRTSVSLFTDADNTLWETDAVYTKAQLNLLKDVENSIGKQGPTEDRLEFLRDLDQRLAAKHHLNLSYPVKYLVRALALSIAGEGLSASVNKSLSGEVSGIKRSIAKSIENRFFDAIINTIPELRPGVASTLKQLHEYNIPIVVVTEGKPDRCQKLLTDHKINEVVSSIVYGSKNVSLYKRLMAKNTSQVKFMIGDQLDRDIEPAQKAGFKTIYYPGGFWPKWLPAEGVVQPDHCISNFKDIIPIVVTG